MINNPKQAVILCGGRGTRLKPLTDSTPKPMVKINGKPFLHYLMEQLSDEGVKDFLLLTGYLKEQISSYFGDANNFDWNIQFSEGPVDWDTGKRIWEARDKIQERFLLLYSDNFSSFNLSKLLRHHEKFDFPLTLTLVKKDLGNISINNDGIVKNYDKQRTHSDSIYVEIGYMLAELRPILQFFKQPDISFTSIISQMVDAKKVSGLIKEDGYYSISDPDRLALTKTYLSNNKIVLIDRDGTMSTGLPRGEYVSKWEYFEWIPKVKEAMKTLADKGFKFIVISNQAGVARGMISPGELDIITKNMEKELAELSIKVLQTYICPHHWDDGCSCRKPKPGMFYQASEDWLFRLDRTIFIGDDPRDCQAASNAGCKSIFLGNQEELLGLKDKELPMSTHDNLFESIPSIREFFNRNAFQ